MLKDGPITIPALLRAFWGRIGLTWLLTFCEMELIALIPLIIGFAIDGLLAKDMTALFQLIVVMAALIQFVISIIVLFAFDSMLALAGALAVIVMLLIYALFDRRLFRLNGQTERPVGILEMRKPQKLLSHLSRLRRVEVQLSDTESILYGAIFVVLLGLIVFIPSYATMNVTISSGTIFSIVSYYWEFVESALALPITLQLVAFVRNHQKDQLSPIGLAAPTWSCAINSPTHRKLEC
mgnify:CR=1 FL=1